MNRDLKRKLATIRRYTGDRFSAARGYDLRKPLSKKRQATIERYFDAVTELTARDHVVYRPKRGQKKEVFAYTGQEGFAYFDRAFIHTPDKDAPLKYEFDRSRPKGSRFQVINKRTLERSWHVPAAPFWDTDDATEDELAAYYEDVLNEYAEDADTFLIMAGDHYMWGAAGNHGAVAHKIADLMQQYGSRYFDPFDSNSSHIGNWFRGATAFSDPASVERIQLERYEAREAFLESHPQYRGDKMRHMRNGDIGIWRDGKLLTALPGRVVERGAEIYREYKNRPRKRKPKRRKK